MLFPTYNIKGYVLKNELDFTATPEYEAWYNANRTKIARQSVFSKGAAAWNAGVRAPSDAKGKAELRVIKFALELAENENDDAAVSFLKAWNNKDAGYLRANWPDFDAFNVVDIASKYPKNTKCAVCGGALYATDSGLVCRNGHGWAHE